MPLKLTWLVGCPFIKTDQLISINNLPSHPYVLLWVIWLALRKDSGLIKPPASLIQSRRKSHPLMLASVSPPGIGLLSKLFIEHGGLEDGWEWWRIHSLEFPICLAKPRNAACIALSHPLWKQDYIPQNTHQRKDPEYKFLGLQKFTWTPHLGTLQMAHFSPNMFHLLIFTNKWAKPTAFCQWWVLPSYYLVCDLYFSSCVYWCTEHISPRAGLLNVLETLVLLNISR